MLNFYTIFLLFFVEYPVLNELFQVVVDPKIAKMAAAFWRSG